MVRRIFSPTVLKTLGILAVIVLIIVAGRMLMPVPLPVIQLPAEVPVRIAGIPITNTLIATLLADVVLLGLAFAATRKMDLVPSGVQNLVEWVIEAWYNLSEDIGGPNARKFFDWSMTVFLFLLVANWMALVPGVDSIGVIESHTVPTAKLASSPGGKEVEDSEVIPHYTVRELLPGVSTLVYEGYRPTAQEYERAHEEHVLPTNPEGRPVGVLVPFVRAAATDLNVTLALAIVAMVLTQIFGVQALGAGYFSKFFNLKGGPMGIFVSVMELISEFSKILSFAFRLFGNLFGGQVLLFVMAFLGTFLLPVPFMGLKIFIGAIQAFVFGMLMLIFFSGAVVSHDDHH